MTDMKTIYVTVKLEIDDSKEDVDTILDNMDYNFSYTFGNYLFDGGVSERELIVNQEIVEYNIERSKENP